MKSSIISTTADSISSGGTITGDLTIDGDLTVSGSNTYTYDEQIDGQVWIKDSTASSSTQGGHLRLFSDDGAAMAAGHRLGVIEFAGAEDTSSTITVGARIEALAESTYTASENGSALLFYTTDGNASQSERMRINSAGQFGLNVSNQDSYYAKELVLGAADQGGITIRGGSSDTGQYLMFADGASGAARYQGYVQYAHSDNQMHFATGASERMTIDANGVGIGTTDPDDVLHLVSASDGGATEMILDNSAAGDSTDELVGFRFRHNGGTAAKIQVGREENFSGSSTRSAFISFKTSKADSETEKMRITADGRVGIGATPVAMHSDYSLLQVGAVGSIFSNTASGTDKSTYIGNNVFKHTDGSWDTIVNDEQSLYEQHGGVHYFYTGAAHASVATLKTNMKIDINSRISLSNNDSNTGNTVFGKSAWNNSSDNASDYNTIFGEGIMGTGAVAGATYNTGVGFDALKNLTAGDYNVAIGALALDAVAVGESYNVAIGLGAMTSVDEGTAGGDADYNVAIGYNALEGGDFAGNDRQLQGNIAIGANAMDSTGANAQTGTVAIGQNALTALTSGADNLAIGYSALDAMTNGDGNLAIGRDALGNLNHTDANNNIAIGAYAGDAMGAYANMGNIFIGYAAGSGTFASASSENIAIGYLAMNSPLDDADGNIAIGALSLQDITQGDKNVSIGYYAGREITTGHSNVIIGGSALVNDTDGALSVVIGYQAGNGLTGSTENTIMGYNACGNFDATADNLAGVVAIGSHAFYGSGDTSDGANNTVAIGRDALKVLSTGGSNTAVGYQAMSETTQGSTNTVFGYRAMYRDAGLANTGNTFIGANAGNGDWTTTASTSNTGVGSGVMQGAMEGATNNTAVGLDGLQALTTGDNNSALGRTALGAVTTGVQNTAVGSFAGDTIQTGSNNTYIGRMTDASASSVANETAIGANATGQGSNTVTLGNADVTDIFMGSDKGAAVRADSNKIVCQGIEFPDTQSASGDDNILDDYEEGTWTPQVYYQNADDQSNVNYDTQVGFYTKIGNVVHIFLKLQWDATDARANDNFGFKNLPFTSKSTTDFHARGSVALSGITSTSITPLALIGANSTTVILVDMSTGSTTANMGNEIGEENNIEMSASLTYLV